MAYATVVDQPVTMEDYRKLLDVVGSEQPTEEAPRVRALRGRPAVHRRLGVAQEHARVFERDGCCPAYAQVFGGQIQPPKMAELDVEVPRPVLVGLSRLRLDRARSSRHRVVVEVSPHGEALATILLSMSGAEAEARFGG